MITAYGIGFLLRFGVAQNQYSKILFILEEMFVVVSPAAFLAFNYIVYGRIMREAVGGRGGYSLLRPNRVSTIFVISDVVTFLMQVCASPIRMPLCNVVLISSFAGQRLGDGSYR